MTWFRPARFTPSHLALLSVTLLLGCEGAPAGEAGAAAGGETSPAGTPQQAAGLGFDLPDGWIAEVPSSSMRAFQAAIPGVGGAGQLSMFHFGVGGGGGTEANLQRWIGQMETAAGDPERAILQTGSYTITWIDLAGTLKASTIGTFPQTDQPDYRLFGAVVEGAGGPWYLRAIGPETTLGEQRDAFLRLLESVRAP